MEKCIRCFYRKSSMINQLLCLVTNQAKFFVYYFNNNMDSQSHLLRRNIEVSWAPPPHDHYKIFFFEDT